MCVTSAISLLATGIGSQCSVCVVCSKKQFPNYLYSVNFCCTLRPNANTLFAYYAILSQYNTNRIFVTTLVTSLHFVLYTPAPMSGRRRRNNGACGSASQVACGGRSVICTHRRQQWAARRPAQGRHQRWPETTITSCRMTTMTTTMNWRRRMCPTIVSLSSLLNLPVSDSLTVAAVAVSAHPYWPGRPLGSCVWRLINPLLKATHAQTGTWYRRDTLCDSAELCFDEEYVVGHSCWVWSRISPPRSRHGNASFAEQSRHCCFWLTLTVMSLAACTAVRRPPHLTSFGAYDARRIHFWTTRENGSGTERKERQVPHSRAKLWIQPIIQTVTLFPH